MTHKRLNTSARKIIRTGHAYPDSVLLFSADGRWLRSSEADNTADTGAAGEAWLFTLPTRQIAAKTTEELSNLHQTLKQQIQKTQSQSGSRKDICSGWAGYFSYEAGCALQGLSYHSALAEFAYYPAVIQLNPQTDEATVRFAESMSKQDQQDWLARFYQQSEEHQTAEAESPRKVDWQRQWDDEFYFSCIHRVHDYLRSGDAYQVNLTMPFNTSENLRKRSPFPLLQQMNPSFGGYLNMRDRSIFSASPERFICFDGQQMVTQPIKGTSRRGSTPDEDESLRQWLAASKKNQAENLMIVDLLRNDLSILAKPFSVQVDKLFDIETHENVHHMVSTIRAELKDDCHPVDVICAALPGGSITGAPKKRAMEIIEELEPQSRGAYCGSMGVFADNGQADFNILIRSIDARDDGASCWAGGGIVIDSTAEDELAELHTKIQKILDCSF
ncbi:MAG: aminodeoxychorismate synthase, component I [Oceanospirillaceae bacterium]|uniref:aminodeoxychorismate synthase component I n=1 Tax=Thalassolituus sp. UBA6592 TaxID=1947665 RepID=UPI000C09AEE1|nr:aminodeoxychorismate synthase component I [Thalassolituus sp. UBA6592]MAK91044.1 aminodeoxychorismate synthase, component I [Thalassolituus sp.]MAS25289.1 aminodeoxychorismate synthase, component I [Oceanospirillaceae bacterium]MAX99909.1 aminodeoxychorismate synthase, component I [Oceanospirillaceae bacterium]MBS53424.1 aminodeoxychorismate synthase, component I [Oceanospirillaceae bacterium]